VAVAFGPVTIERAGQVGVPHWFNPATRLKALRAGVARHLPEAWQAAIYWRGQAARAWRGLTHDEYRDGALNKHHESWYRPDFDRQAEADVYAAWLTEFADASGADLSELSIRERAEKVAALGRAGGFVADVEGSIEGAFDRLVQFLRRFGARVALRLGVDSLKEWAARAGCAKFWRRQLRRWVAQQSERGAIKLGLVGAGAGQWYCSNAAVKRRVYQNKANESAMRASKIESESGQRMSVWDAAQKSVSNKAIRRGELMTRIRGCEEWAESQDLAGIFTTNTCPSRFHSHLKHGPPNPKHKGETPADAQAWLSKQWAKARAKFSRDGVGVMGFRVAEPHHDGCPHWHMLLWCAPRDVDYVTAVLRRYWLSEDGDEPGAGRHRLNVKAMIAGQASGYIAKYISKNIDDVATGQHFDHAAPGMVVGPDLLGDMEIKPCRRVEAWAATWRIRQFQAIGQPSVTVWREMRRVKQEQAAGGSDALLMAWLAVHRHGERRADWAGYMKAQGGAMRRRDAYRLCVQHVERGRVGRYGEVVEHWACGVRDRTAGRLGAVPTKRERWGGEGFALAVGSPPWTRLNNCTSHNRATLGKVSGDVQHMVVAGLLDIEGGFKSRWRHADTQQND
jgi:Bacteriophage replication gene A protein (GPA)